MGNLNTLVNWFKQREGKVTYSMTYRNGPNSYDCSSAVYFALIEAGFLPKSSGIGNTESLYRLEGSVLQPISRSEVKFGDIFVAGVKGASGGAFGHTGVAISNSQIIHCNGSANGISTTGISNAATGTPCHWYRLKEVSGSTNSGTGETVKIANHATHYSPTSKSLAIPNWVKGKSYKVLEKRPIKYSKSNYEYLLDGIMSWVLSQDIEGGSTVTITPPSIAHGKWIAENGTFVPDKTINVRDAASTSGRYVASYSPGEAVYYDKYMIDQNGYVWIHYVSHTGHDRYMASGESRNGERINYWGAFY